MPAMIVCLTAGSEGGVVGVHQRLLGLQTKGIRDTQKATGHKTQGTKRSARILTSPVQSFAPAVEMELGGPPDGSGSPFEHM